MSKVQKRTGFEEALARLQKIIVALESESTPLQESVRLYEEGIGLVEECARTLSEAQATLQLLRVRADGVFELIDAHE
jgi:exodeoxyribonuclease VII small subunit